MRARLGRECLYVPSCRLGLYVALRHGCEPGGKILMSPVNDDVILFVVLAAGLRPVQAPLSAADGSIDVDAVPDSVWNGLRAVLTTNLYGNPDPARRLRERCDRLGIPLVEDAAHAIGSVTDGDPVGSFGDAAVFSLSKHVGAKAGGFLAVADPARRAPLERARDTLLDPARLTAELAYAVRPYAESAVRGLRLAPGGLVDPAPPRPPGTGGDPDAAAPRGTGARPGRHALAGHGSTAWPKRSRRPVLRYWADFHPIRVRSASGSRSSRTNRTSPASRPSLRSLARVVLRNFGDPARSAFS